jgi:hypothetical protein
VQSIYPGLDDPGMTRLLRPEREREPVRPVAMPRVVMA